MSLTQQLVQAVEDGNINVLIRLLMKKHDMTRTVDTYISRDGYRPMRGVSPLHLAARKGDREAVIRLLDCGYPADIINKYDGRSCVHYAAVGGHVDIVDTLVGCGADINMVDFMGNTALHDVILLPHKPKTLKKLVKLGIDINAQNKQGDSALHLAMVQPVSAVEILLSLKCDVTLKNSEGDTPLHFAARNRSMDFIEELVSVGARVNVVNSKRQTPLHIACSHFNEEAIEALLQCGSNPTKTDRKKKRPEDLVKSPRMKNLLKLMAAVEGTTEAGNLIQTERLVFYPGKSLLPLAIDRVGLTVNTLRKTLGPCSIYCRRERAEDSELDVGLTEEEELASDIFTVSAASGSQECEIFWSVPFYRCPGEREELMVKFVEGPAFRLTSWRGKDRSLVCHVRTLLENFVQLSFAVILREKKERYTVVPDGTFITSEADERLALNVPTGAYTKDTSLDLQVYKCGLSEERGKDGTPWLVLTDVYQINTKTRKPPKKDILMRIPFRQGLRGTDNVIILTADEKTMKDKNSFKVLQYDPAIVRSCLVFPLQHFSIYVATTLSLVSGNWKLLYEQVEKSIGKRFNVVFYAVIKPVYDGTYLAYVECTLADKGRDRRYWYKDKGYYTQEPIETPPITIQKGHKFTLDVIGDICLVDPNCRRDLISSTVQSSRQKLFLKPRLSNKNKPVDGAIIISRQIAPKDQGKLGSYAATYKLPVCLQQTGSKVSPRKTTAKPAKEREFWKMYNNTLF